MEVNHKTITWKDYTFRNEQNEHPPSTIFHKHVSKRIARILTFIFLKMNVSPNKLSFASFIFVLLSILGFLIIEDAFLGSLTFLILSQLSYAIDCSDGVVARINRKTSYFGGFLDLTLDRLSSNFLMIGVLYHLFINGTETLLIFLSLIGFITYQFYSYMSDIRGFTYKKLKGYTKNIESKSFKKKIILFIYEFIDTGTFYFILFVGFFFQIIPLIMLMYFVLSIILIMGNYYLLFSLKEDT